MDEECNTKSKANPISVEDMTPLVEALAESTEQQMQQALKTLEARVTVLEEQLARMSDESKP